VCDARDHLIDVAVGTVKSDGFALAGEAYIWCHRRLAAVHWLGDASVKLLI
jgi:hypothetical protein